MKYQVLMSPNNGQLVVGIPLFRRPESETTTISSISGSSYSITLMEDNKPSAYIIDCGSFAQVLAAEWVEKHLINLGDL